MLDIIVSVTRLRGFKALFLSVGFLPEKPTNFRGCDLYAYTHYTRLSLRGKNRAHDVVGISQSAAKGYFHLPLHKRLGYSLSEVEDAVEAAVDFFFYRWPKYKFWQHA